MSEMGKGDCLHTTKAKDPTHCIFGKSDTDETIHMCISEGPHWIICGQTGSGKSVAMNFILNSMMFKSDPGGLVDPAELRLVIIDPKLVEFAKFKGCPYMLCDPVTNMSDAYGLMQYLAWEMDRRYELLTVAGVREIKSYHQKFKADPELAKKCGNDYMPYIVCVIDEYNDMVMQEKTVEEPIIRLGQKARACGISLLIATQRPSADVITPLLKANCPARIGLKTADSVNSMIIIDEAGCEELKGYGDAYIKTGAGDKYRVQFPFLTDQMIDDTLKAVKERFGTSEPFDYKEVVVKAGLCEWATEDGEPYGDAVKAEDRHVRKPARRPRW